MTTYYLAVDIGASSGRHIIGTYTDGKIQIEEIYRFKNNIINDNGSLTWDLNYLFSEILNGMKVCKSINKIPKSIAIDTWGVDYVLLDKNDKILGKTYSYRDSRTQKVYEKVYETISPKDLYMRTGIQQKTFNTIYQLTASKTNEPTIYSQAKTFLMLPDYFNFLLTGNKKSEYTNATTTQLVSPVTKEWDKQLIDNLGLNSEIFLPLSEPREYVGKLKKEIEKKVGFNCDVILCATHDTASAVAAVPNASYETIYISSGTWSLIGVENKDAIFTQESLEHNFTNEGGIDYKFRFLKNIMGLWMIQSVQRETDTRLSFEEFCTIAQTEKDFPSRIDVNDDVFFAPESMVAAVKNYCYNTNQPVPDSLGKILSVIYYSLAESYSDAVNEIEKITKKSYKTVNIIGGGCNADYLNRLTAKATKKTVFAGPDEATAIGNILVQMIRDGIFSDIEKARKCVQKSFKIKKYENN